MVDALVRRIVAAGLRLDRFQHLVSLNRIVKAASERDIFPHFFAGRDNLFLLVRAGGLLAGQIFPDKAERPVQILLLGSKLLLVFHQKLLLCNSNQVSVSYDYTMLERNLQVGM